MTSVLYQQYKEKVVPALREQLGVTNNLAVPKVEKIVLSVAYGRQVKDQAYIDNLENTLTVITGQKPVHHKAKKSISNFKIRQGQNIGASVTLRGTAMYDFLYKLIHLTFPRVRDFRGVSPKSFDAHGNYTFGFKEHVAFPEVKSDAIDKIHGLEVTIVTSARTKAAAMSLLKAFGFPFRDK